jgi:hypothetical protein
MPPFFLTILYNTSKPTNQPTNQLHGPGTKFLQDFLKGSVKILIDPEAEPQQEETATMNPVSSRLSGGRN